MRWLPPAIVRECRKRTSLGMAALSASFPLLQMVANFCPAAIGSCRVCMMMVVVTAPELELPPDLCDAEENFYVQALVAQSSVERFNVAVLNRVSGPNEIWMYSVQIQPMIHSLAGELSSIVHGDRLGCTAVRNHLIEGRCDLLSAQCRAGVDRQALAAVLIDKCQHSEPAASSEPVFDEPHAPYLVIARTHGR